MMIGVDGDHDQGAVFVEKSVAIVMFCIGLNRKVETDDELAKEIVSMHGSSSLAVSTLMPGIKRFYSANNEGEAGPCALCIITMQRSLHALDIDPIRFHCLSSSDWTPCCSLRIV